MTPATTRVPQAPGATSARARRAAPLAGLLRASARPVLQPGLLALAAAGAVLPLVTVSALDGPHALNILRGVGVLLTCALLVSVDDPSGEVLAASPYPPAVRIGARALVGAAVVAPIWVLAGALVQWRQPYLPVPAVGLEACGFALVGLLVAVGLRRWRDLHHPSAVAAPALLAIVVIVESLPRWYALTTDQTWGPPWAAAHLRWLAVVLLAAALLSIAVRDPWHAWGRRK